MFVRVRDKANGKVAISIVENVRDSGKVCQKTLRTVATVPPEDVERFRELAEHIKLEMESSTQPHLFPIPYLAEILVISRIKSIGDESPLPVNMRKIREEARIVSGIHDIYGSLYDEIGFSKVMKKCRVSASILKDIVMARLAKPCSKRSSTELLERDFGIKIDLAQLSPLKLFFTKI